MVENLIPWVSWLRWVTGHCVMGKHSSQILSREKSRQMTNNFTTQAKCLGATWLKTLLTTTKIWSLHFANWRMVSHWACISFYVRLNVGFILKGTNIFWFYGSWVIMGMIWNSDQPISQYAAIRIPPNWKLKQSFPWLILKHFWIKIQLKYFMTQDDHK